MNEGATELFWLATEGVMLPMSGSCLLFLPGRKKVLA
jgi:hypothetical protein